MRVCQHDRVEKRKKKTGLSLPANSSCEGRVSLHFTQSGLSIPTAAGIVVERGSEYLLAHTGPRELDGHPLGGCGSGFGLVEKSTGNSDLEKLQWHECMGQVCGPGCISSDWASRS